MLFILSLLIAFWGIRERSDFSKVLRIFFITALIAALVGIIEIFAFRFAPSLNNLWLFFNAGNIVEIWDGKINLTSYRPCPFVYEPRYFGFAMGFTGCLSFLCRMFPIPDIPKWATNPFFIAICFLLLLVSASISAVTGFLSGFIVLTLWLIVYRQIVQKRVFKYAIIFFAIISIFLLNSQLLVYRFYNYMFQAGFLDQLGWINPLVYPQGAKLSTSAYFSFFVDQPLHLIVGTGFGNGCFYAYDFLLGSSGFLRSGFMTSRLPIIDLISDVGILGMVFLFSLWIGWWRKLGSFSKQFEDGDQAHYFEIIRGMLVFLAISGFFFDTYALTWFFFGVGFALTLRDKLVI